MDTSDLVECVELFCFLHNTGVSRLNKDLNTKFEEVDVHDILAVLPVSLEEIYIYNNQYKILEHSINTSKVCIFLASQLKKQNISYDATPFFFGYFKMLDYFVRAKAVSHFALPNISALCENLDRYLSNGETLAPYLFIKGIEFILGLSWSLTQESLHAEVLEVKHPHDTNCPDQITLKAFLKSFGII
jgi:hypothetical protein